MANIAISQLPTAISLSGAELVPVDQPGGFGDYTTVAATVGQIANAPVNAPFVMAVASPLVPQGRALTEAAGQTVITDGGAGEDITVGLADTAVTPDTYGDSTHIVQITVDQKGRITSAENIDISTAISGLILAYFQALPTSLPAQPNQPWNNGGVVSMS